MWRRECRAKANHTIARLAVPLTCKIVVIRIPCCEMSVSTKSGQDPPWLLLVFSLPRKGASLRVAMWRKLQRYGALPLGNSGYLLPSDPQSRERFEWLATTIRSQRCEASVVEVQSIDNVSNEQLIRRFVDVRTRDYRALLREAQKPLGRPSPREAARIARLRRRFQEIASFDFFGSPLRDQTERALNAMQSAQVKTIHPEMPGVSRAAYRRRTWVTRPRPGVDRVTSAWLIRKFIDPKARFVFATEHKKPADAVPFDMYEGGFGHRGDDCTFETLVKAFRIADRKVGVMAQIVHDADLFDQKFGRNEGFGIDKVMKGWARLHLDDPELLNRGMQLADGLYRSL